MTLNKDIAKAALQFLLRVQLQGHEVPTFNAVMAALDAVAKDDGIADVAESMRDKAHRDEHQHRHENG